MGLSKFWQRFGAAKPTHTDRWVVVDVETSGLDASRARLLAIAAIGVRMLGNRPVICPWDSFEVVLQQPADATQEVDKENILIHGIGVGSQRTGMEPLKALEAFESWLGESPLIGFHVAFDEAMIQRAMKQHRGRRLSNAWLDLEHVAEMVRPESGSRTLDEWMNELSIHCLARHEAAADTLATAEVMLSLWPEISKEIGEPVTWRALSDLAARRRWLPR